MDRCSLHGFGTQQQHQRSIDRLDHKRLIDGLDGLAFLDSSANGIDGCQEGDESKRSGKKH